MLGPPRKGYTWASAPGAVRGGRSEPIDGLADTLHKAATGDELALLHVTRRLGTIFETLGAYTVRKEWTREIREIALEATESWPSARTEASDFLHRLARNRLWGCVLDLMGEGHIGAGELFFPTVRRLVARWDGARATEAAWDDIASETAQQLWTQWQKGGVEQPWSLLCTIAKRRFLDRVRATRPTDAIDDLPEEAGEGEGDETFTEEILGVLEDQERDIIVRMDIEGYTRVEIATSLGLSEGQVLSVRRAGLRRIWRHLGAQLPPRLREVWEEMFKGSKRPSPEQVAQKMDIPPGEVLSRLEEAQKLVGLPQIGGFG